MTPNIYKYALITLLFSCQLSSPEARPDALSTNEDEPISIKISSLLENDLGELTLLSAQEATNGSIVQMASEIVFTPTPNFSGEGSFTYTATDQRGALTIGRVSIEIIAVADVPNVTFFDIVGEEDSAIPFEIEQSLSDSDGSEQLSVVLFGFPAGTTFSAGTPSESLHSLTQEQLTGLSITPPPNFHGDILLNGVATKTELSNQSVGVSIFDVLVDVSPVNDAPIVSGEQLALAEDTPRTIQASELLSNDADVDGDSLTLISVQNGVNGFVEIEDGLVTFHPALNLHGAASFEYTVSDGQLNSTEQVTLEIVPVADTPSLFASDAVGRMGAFRPLPISASLNDTDGSEELSVTLEGDLVGLTFSAGVLQTASTPRFLQKTTAVTPGTEKISVGRFNTDTLDDVVVVNSDSIIVIPGDSSSNLEISSLIVSEDSIESFSVGDFNGDTLDDIAFITNDQINRHIKLLICDSISGFIETSSISINTSGNIEVVFANINNDNLSDIVIIDQKLHVFFGNTDNIIGIPISTNLGITLDEADEAINSDFDNNGSDDIAIMSQGTIFVYYLNEAGEIISSVEVDSGSTSIVKRIKAGDFDEDGFVDILMSSNNSIKVFRNIQGINFSFILPIPVMDLSLVRDFLFTKIHSNDSNDIIAFNSNGRISIITNLQEGLLAAIQSTVTLQADTGLVSLVAGRFNGDGTVDFLSANQSGVLRSFFQNPALRLNASELAGLQMMFNPGMQGERSLSAKASATELSPPSSRASISHPFTVSLHDFPVANDDTLPDTQEDTVTQFSKSLLLLNDVSADNFVISSMQDAQHCSFIGQDLFSFRISPEPNYVGPASFSYTITDALGDTATATATFQIVAVNDPPTMNAVTSQTIEDHVSPAPILISGITAGPANESAQALTLAVSSSNPAVANPLASSIQNGTATLTYAPLSVGITTITLTLRDDGGTELGGIDTLTQQFTLEVRLGLVCGNGVIQAGEQCDDGDSTSGDGCSNTCQLEAGFTCDGEPSVCDNPCGNGIFEPDLAEECDDGNRSATDGCSDECLIETQLVSGDNFTCALSLDNSVHCWGQNNFGQLGIGSTNNIGDNPGEMPPALTQVAATGETIQKIVAMSESACALMTNGNVRCWGRNNLGQLGIGNTNNIGDNPGEMPPAAVNLGGAAFDIAAGSSHLCAILNGGSVKCWGNNAFGALGIGNGNRIGDNAGEMPPADTNIGAAAQQIAAGNNSSCALLVTGSLRCWGENSKGTLGINSTSNIGDQPSEMPPANTNFGSGAIKKLSMRGSSTCVLTSANSLRCWGENGFGQLGIGSTNNIGDNPGEMPPTAVSFSGTQTIRDFRMGGSHVCALLSDSIRCWGRNNLGQLGIGGTSNIGDSLAELPLGTAAILGAGVMYQLSSGAAFSCVSLSGAAGSNGRVRCWGQNNFGQLGIGDTNTIGDSFAELPPAETQLQ